MLLMLLIWSQWFQSLLWSFSPKSSWHLCSSCCWGPVCAQKVACCCIVIGCYGYKSSFGANKSNVSYHMLYCQRLRDQVFFSQNQSFWQCSFCSSCSTSRKVHQQLWQRGQHMLAGSQCVSPWCPDVLSSWRHGSQSHLLWGILENILSLCY